MPSANNTDKSVKSYKLQKVLKYKLPIPCLLWVPTWLTGIVVARFCQIPLSVIIYLSILSLVLFCVPKIRTLSHKCQLLTNSYRSAFRRLALSDGLWQSEIAATEGKLTLMTLSLPLLSFIAGFLIYSLSIDLPEHHIHNIFRNNDIQTDTTYISENNLWTAYQYTDKLNNYQYIQQYIRAKAVSETEKTDYGFKVEIELLALGEHKLTGKITLFLETDSLKYGDIFESTLVIRENRVSNPGEINYGEIMRQSGIYGTANHISPIYIIDNEANLFYYYLFFIKNKIREKYQNVLNYSSNMALSLILGERKYLNEYAENLYNEILPASGLMHFFAVSGFHVAIIGLFLISIFKLIRLKKYIYQVITILLLIIYAFLCSLSPPIVRSVIFFSIFMISELTSRIISKWQILLFSLFIVTLFKPNVLFTVSLQFSYLAFCGIIISQDIKKRYYNKIKNKYISYIINYFLTIICIQILILPLQIYYFKYFNLNTFIGNIIGVVFVSLLLPIYILILIIPKTLFIYKFIVLNSEFITEKFIFCIELIARLPFKILYTVGLKELIFLFGFIFLGLLLISYGKNNKRILQGFMTILLSFILLVPTEKDKSFEVIFFDTGNSDCFLFRFSKDDYLLIDTADYSNNSKNISRNLILHLKNEGVKNISKVILTHQHTDHYEGIFELSKHIKIDTLIVSNRFYESNIGYQIRNNENFQNTIFFVLSDTLTYKNKDYNIQFLHPDKNFTHPNENNHSIVCKISLNDITLLFTGDIEAEAENHLITHYGKYLKADVLKAAHHGSKTSSQLNFLNHVKPELVIFSATDDDRALFPHNDVIQRTNLLSNKIFITRKGGAILIINS